MAALEITIDGSDHRIISALAPIRRKKKSKRKQKACRKKIRVRMLFAEGQLGHDIREKFRKKLRAGIPTLKAMMSHVLRKHNPARAMRQITLHITNLYKKAAKQACGESKVRFRRTKSWWDKDCTPLHKAWNDATAKARLTKREEDINNARKLREEWRTMKKEKQKSFDKEQDREAIQRFKENKPNWWKAVRGMENKGALNISTAFINGISGMTTNDDARIAEAFKNHYENLAKDEPKPHFKEEEYTKTIKEVEQIIKEETEHPELDFNSIITEQEIEQVRLTLKHDKAAGLDNIAPEMLKYGKKVTDEILALLFNACFEKGVVHSKLWRKARIVSLHKSGDKRKTGNYRGISLHSVMGKMYASVLNNRLSAFLEGNNPQKNPARERSKRIQNRGRM